MKNQLGEKTAQQVLGHIEGGSVLHNNYARGVQTMDMAALRAPEAGEGDVQRAEVSFETLSFATLFTSSFSFSFRKP